MEDAGTCFGWQVQSSAALLFTRATGTVGSGPIEIIAADTEPASEDEELVLSWTRTERNPVTAQVYRGPDRSHYRVFVEGGGWFVVEHRIPRISIPVEAESVRREERLWGLPALLCFLERGDLPMHAAAVEIDGRAVLLAGPSRAGKTTLAAAAVARGWRLLSEDLSCVQLGGTPAVLPGPASLRVREDVADDLDLRGHRSWQLGDDRTHLALEREVRGTGDPVPLAGVYLLHPGRQVAVRTPDPTTALRDLWAVSFRIPDVVDRVRCFDQLAELIGAVPVLELERPLRTEDLESTLDALASSIDS